uniref:Uncharacterized protein n=1 Tax=Acrobeloides nanus TaxID=290746 RepID=A0A914DCK2_9BILA
MTLALTTKTPTYAFFNANETLFTTTMSSNQCPATEHWGCPGKMCDGKCCNDGVCYTTDDSSATITDCEWSMCFNQRKLPSPAWLFNID